MDQAIVVLVYKTGGEFTREYVYRLVESIDNQVVVLTDDDQLDHDLIVPLRHDLPGWWSKLELFGLSPKYKYVYFDLDTVVKGDIDELANLDHRFTMLKGLSGTNRPASGVMAWHGDYSYLLDEVLKDRSIMDLYTPSKGGKLGDQVYIEEYLGFTPDYFQDMLPDDYITSYKLSTLEQKQRSAVVCYHGRPRPHETNWAPL